MANVSGSSAEEDDVFSSQFAALLKPIRELTKQGCWELNIAEKLDEYVHYIQDLPIEVNVNGEQMKLDFAKAAMVVQNTVQIYSKKVENLWLLLQEVIEFLSSHGNNGEGNEDGQNPSGIKLKRNARRRHQKGEVDLLEPISLKFRKLNLKMKKKAFKDLKRIQTLPYEILQLEEVVGSANPLKIKLYTLSNEHLGYPSDLRSNFPFNPQTFFLKIDHAKTAMIEVLPANPAEAQIEAEPENVPAALDEIEDQPPMLDDWQNDEGPPSDNESMPPPPPVNRTTEVHVERMQLRSRAPVPVKQPREIKDPWLGMEPYYDDETVKKPCGPPIRCRIPAKLQKRKRKKAGKVTIQEETIVGIDEYLGKVNIGLKKPVMKYCQPENEFWEDYVHFTKTTGTAIKKQRKLQPENGAPGGMDESELDDDPVNNDQDDLPDREDLLDTSNRSHDEFHFEGQNSPNVQQSPSKDADESKQFFELVQQFMAEYTATAKEFVHSTESTRRVQAWHEMIQPRLREAESRRDFDIHEYGSRIIQEFGTEAPVGSQCTFGKVVQKQPKNEVARFFLATLQLANAYNLEIALQDGLSVDSVELKLLSRERHHEHMDEFMS